MDGPRAAISMVVDPEHRRVALTLDRWQHIVERHPQLIGHRNDILRAVRSPTIFHARSLSESWFYLSGAGPSKWLKVVVVYSSGMGRIITAFPRRAHP